MPLRDVRVPADNKLAEAHSFRDATRVLTATRGGAAWESLGHAVAAYEIALDYAQQRQQFGQPIASFQLVQHKLATMLAEITSMQLYCFRMAQLQEQGRFTGPMASLAKMNHAQKARQVCLDARDILGGNGLLIELPHRPAPDRHGGRAHLRGHRLHPGADRRPRHHRHLRVHLIAFPLPAASSSCLRRPSPGRSARRWTASGSTPPRAARSGGRR